MALATRAITNIEIHPAATIGQGLFIDHGTGVVVGETAQIGDNVTLYQGVTLGGTGFATGKRHPTVQDNVTIGSGAKLLGPITVGHGAKIGANSVVITDVPPNSTVVGNPGHVVRVDGRKPEGPDADWIHLPDPVADAIRALSSRLDALERAVAERDGAPDRAARRRRRAARGGPPAVPAPRPEPAPAADLVASRAARGMIGPWPTSKASSPPSRRRSTPPARSTRRRSSATSRRTSTRACTGSSRTGRWARPEASAREERRTVVATIARAAAGRVPVIAGVSAGTPSAAIGLAADAAEAGATALMMLPPLGYHGDAREVDRLLPRGRRGGRPAAHGLQQPGGERRRHGAAS